MITIVDIPGAEYQQIVELLKGQSVPDDALQQELLAFKRYFIYEQKNAIIGAEKTRMTGNFKYKITINCTNTSTNTNTNRTTSCLHAICTRFY